VESTNKEVGINTSPDNKYYEVVPYNVSEYTIAHSDVTVLRLSSDTRWIENFFCSQSRFECGGSKTIASSVSETMASQPVTRGTFQ
jgi:hypothetical protein